MVVGGRIMKQGLVIYLQPQVAKLIGPRTVDTSTVKWLPMPEIQEPRHEDLVELSFTKRHMPRGNFSFENGIYMTGELAISNFLAIILFFLGFRFKSGFHSEENTIDIEVIGKKFEFINGTAVESYEEFKNAPPTNPELSQFTIDSEEHHAGQYLSPAFDSQPVTMDNPLPLSGIRLQYYAIDRRFFHQFLVLRLMTIDLKEHQMYDDVKKNENNSTLP